MNYEIMNSTYNIQKLVSSFPIGRLIYIILLVLFPVMIVFGQEPRDSVPDGTEGEFFKPIDSVKKKKPFNEFNLGFTTFKFGGGFLYEFGTFSQDEEAGKQADSANITLEPTWKVRDTRLLFSGKLNTKRAITWKAGIMYDGPSDAWFIRESGVMVAVPELWGHFFIGRTKEGTSLNKVMNGYAGWTMERHIAIDVIPILADGIKWLGYLPKQRILWNLGVFSDWTSENESFSTFDWQAVLRLAHLPIYKPEEKKLLHVGTSLRVAAPDEGKMRLRSRPEANTAPYFIDTDVFSSDKSNSIGFEVYYTSGPLQIGSEYYFHNFNSSTAGNVGFNGGEIGITYILTGESRPYTTIGGIYGFAPVNRSVFKGGPGSWELVLRASHLDLDDGPIRGGKFWRVTPMVNWYLSKNVRMAFTYGYGVLDRYQLKGATQFFQTRIQLMLL